MGHVSKGQARLEADGVSSRDMSEALVTDNVKRKAKTEVSKLGLLTDGTQ